MQEPSAAADLHESIVSARASKHVCLGAAAAHDGAWVSPADCQLFFSTVFFVSFTVLSSQFLLGQRQLACLGLATHFTWKGNDTSSVH